jgi:uncharacterized membrane protein YdjX (TVP38/TMEM64 family)
MKQKNIIKTVIFLSVIFVFVLLSYHLNFGHWFDKFRTWVNSVGYWGGIAFIFIYALAVTALIPGIALTIAAGAIFGSFWGVTIVSIASTLGSGLSFFIARYFARDIVSEWVQKHQKFKELDELTQNHGEIIVAVTRLIPIFPYTLLNYGFGLTKVSFKIYIFWSWLCMLPGTVLYVVGTDAVVETIINGKIQPAHVVVIVISLVLIGIVTKYARRFLHRGDKHAV